MRKAIFISILLTVCTVVQAQGIPEEKPVRLVFTTHFQGCPFGQSPVWGNWPEGSMARAMSYIRSHRQAMGEDHFAWLNCGEQFSDSYRLYPFEDIPGRIYDYLGYLQPGKEPFFHRQDILFQDIYIARDSISIGKFQADTGIKLGLFTSRESTPEEVAKISGLHLAVMASGREPEVFKIINIAGDTVTVINTGTTGKYIGVVDFRSATDFTAKTVDISGFPVDAEYEEHFKPLSDSMRVYFNAPVTTLTHTIRQSDALPGSSAYAGLFHRFQMEATDADVSLFACPVWGDSIPAGPITLKDIVRRFRYDNRLCVLELTGSEIKSYLEYTYGLRYHTMRRSTDDLLRMTRDRDGILRMRTAVYNLDEADGICYEVDVSKPQGRRVRIISMKDGNPFESGKLYRVTMNSHRALSGGYLSRGTGLSEAVIKARVIWTSEADYRVLLRNWMATQDKIMPENQDNWQVIPELFVEAAKERWIE